MEVSLSPWLRADDWWVRTAQPRVRAEAETPAIPARRRRARAGISPSGPVHLGNLRRADDPRTSSRTRCASRGCRAGHILSLGPNYTTGCARIPARLPPSRSPSTSAGRLTAGADPCGPAPKLGRALQGAAGASRWPGLRHPRHEISQTPDVHLRRLHRADHPWPCAAGPDIGRGAGQVPDQAISRAGRTTTKPRPTPKGEYYPGSGPYCVACGAR